MLVDSKLATQPQNLNLPTSPTLTITTPPQNLRQHEITRSHTKDFSTLIYLIFGPSIHTQRPTSTTMRHFTTNKRPLPPPTLQDRFQSRSPTPEETATKTSKNGPDETKINETEEGEEEEEEDDYMNMTFSENPTIPETSLQRRQRLHAEGLKRGAVPSKADLLAKERARREEGLAKSLLHPEPSASTSKKSKGLSMMAKMGFKPGAKLGAKDREDKDNDARVEPIRIEVRQDRGGIGLDGERKRKLQEEAAAAAAGGADSATKKPKVEVDPVAYRDRMARERDAARKETLVGAAQKIAERMDEDDRAPGVVVVEEGDDDDDDNDDDDEAARERKRKAAGRTSLGGPASSSRPLKAVPVLYRGLVRHREEKERDRRMRHDLETSLGSTLLNDKSLPAYEDEGMDADDKMALGKEEKKMVYMTADDLDEEDEELDQWEALEVDERLKRLVEYLRMKYRYCFWCKFAYPDESMEGCPGVTEEEHE